jgi:hypothetical protein
MMGKHYGLFTDRIEAVVPERSSEEIQIELTAKLQQYLWKKVYLIHALTFCLNA